MTTQALRELRELREQPQGYREHPRRTWGQYRRPQRWRQAPPLPHTGGARPAAQVLRR